MRSKTRLFVFFENLPRAFINRRRIGFVFAFQGDVLRFVYSYSIRFDRYYRSICEVKKKNNEYSRILSLVAILEQTFLRTSQVQPDLQDQNLSREFCNSFYCNRNSIKNKSTSVTKEIRGRDFPSTNSKSLQIGRFAFDIHASSNYHSNTSNSRKLTKYLKILL